MAECLRIGFYGPNGESTKAWILCVSYQRLMSLSYQPLVFGPADNHRAEMIVAQRCQFAAWLLCVLACLPL